MAKSNNEKKKKTPNNLLIYFTCSTYRCQNVNRSAAPHASSTKSSTLTDLGRIAWMLITISEWGGRRRRGGYDQSIDRPSRWATTSVVVCAVSGHKSSLSSSPRIPFTNAILIVKSAGKLITHHLPRIVVFLLVEYKLTSSVDIHIRYTAQGDSSW